MSNPGDKLASMSPAEKRALLEKLLKERAAQNQVRPSGLRLERAPRDGKLVLSTGQERLWFLDKFQQGSTANTLLWVLQIDGALDRTIFEKSVDELMRRHEIFRITFRMEGAEPVQVIHPPGPLRYRTVDLTGREEAERRGALVDRVWEAVYRKIDLERGPTNQFELVVVGPQSHTLIWTLHHMVFDNWSNGIVLQELASIYAAFLAGQPSPLPEPNFQYVDFAWSARKSAANGGMDAHLAYWKKQVEGLPPLLELPTDRPRSPVQTFDGGVVPWDLDPQVVRKLRELCLKEGATMFMVLLAAYSNLLSRYARQEDLTVGAVVSARSQPELENMLGYFINVLPMRMRLEGKPTFRQLVARVREVVLGGFTHQDLPLENIVALLPGRDPSYSAMFQVLFNYFKEPPAQQLAPGLRVYEVSVPEVKANPSTLVSLAITVGDGPGEEQLGGTVQYASDLFDATTIERFAGHFLALLERVAEAPDAPLSSFPLLTAAEWQRLVVAQSTSATEVPALCLHQLFEAQVARTPEALAVRCGSDELTYQQLDARANQLARMLRKMGVGAEQRVAVCMSPSVNAIVSILGVLKAGGAYVPLDPESPAERLAFALKDSDVRVALTETAVAPRLTAPDLTVICLDTGWSIVARESPQPPRWPVDPQQLAYVIYTSGSTGQPKGVLVEHRSVVNHSVTVARRFGLGAADRMLQFTPLHFDAAGEEIYPPLFSGSAIVIRGELVATEQFRQLIEDEHLTVLSLPPAYLHEWLSQLGAQGGTIPPGMRLVILGGEKLLPETRMLWEQLGGAGVPWINVYGPTEATITAAMFEISGALQQPVIPIGRPIDNVQLYVLDDDLQPVVIGHTGELYLSGAGLARGYVGRPEQAAERFVPNPFSGTPGQRMYRTGDRVRFLPDGNVEFMGRADEQVKIRGHRIELGEIEAIVRGVPGVQEAVVLAREEAPGDLRLVAYVVWQKGRADAGALRTAVKEKLPAYMMPSAFVDLPALPLSANGKIDRKALPAPSYADAAADRRAPRTVEEFRLAEVWEEVLGSGPVGINQDFFSIGGHSLAALRVLDRIKQLFDVDLSVVAFFQNATIESLSSLIAAQRSVARQEARLIVPIQPRGDRPPLFFVHLPLGDLVTYLPLVKPLGPDQPVYGITACEFFDEAGGAVETRAARYVAELTKAFPKGPYQLLGDFQSGPVAMEMARLLEQQGASVALLGLVNSFCRHEDVVRLLPALARSRERRQAGLTTEAEEPLWLLADFTDQLTDEFRQLDPAARPAQVLQGEQRRGYVSADYTLDDLDRSVRLLHDSYQALERYAPRAYAGRVVLFATEDVRAEAGPTLGWEKVCASLQVEPLTGDLEGRLDGENAVRVARRIREAADGRSA